MSGKCKSTYSPVQESKETSSVLSPLIILDEEILNEWSNIRAALNSHLIQ